tara:strand:+ start:283 stop:438 length:156 start_codon:yes stop_codon:yes gene_type:complete
MKKIEVRTTLINGSLKNKPFTTESEQVIKIHIDSLFKIIEGKEYRVTIKEL